MPDDPSNAELERLISQLTLDGKARLLAGENVWETASVERLGIPSLKTSDGPNGARGGDFFDGTTAACFPACVSLAATFNRDLSYRIGVAIGQEAQTKGASVLLGPTVCMHRSPLGGRNFEAFSEDPLLSGALATQYVRGLQSQRVGATVKHFVANEQDTKRFSVNEKISQRALREIYLRPFEIVVKDADPWCVMSSYPKVNGAHVDAQSTFIDHILRREWGFQGMVMSDWGATSDAVASIRNGLDLEMPGPPHRRTPKVVTDAVQGGQVTINEIDGCIMSLLKLLRRAGKFSDRKDTPNEQAISRPEHEALIREAGAEGIVLLKNSQNTLPIVPEKCRKIAMLGPLAKVAAAHGGGSASLNCHYKISAHDAFKARLGDCNLTYSKGTHIFRIYPDLEAGCVNRNGNAGFIAEYFKAPDLAGDPFHVVEYPRGSFTTLMNRGAAGARSVRFSTKYRPPVTGEHYLSFSGLGPAKMFIDGQIASNQEKESRDSMAFLLGVQDEHRFQYSFDATRTYDIVVESMPSQVDNSELHLLREQLSVHIGYVPQREMEEDLLAEAVGLAKNADLAVCFVGNTAQWETEGQDLSSMTLPANGSQDTLVAKVAEANPNTVVVITTGVPVELPWVNQVRAVVQAWYAGQETGNAILDVLLGDINPSGKLPISWPAKYEHTGCYGNFGLDSYESGEVEYAEDVNVGYRHFDRLYGTDKQVLYPFGFGLSYSTFDIRDVEVSGTFIDHDKGEIAISLTVKNTSERSGAETIQVYLEPPRTEDSQRPPQSLVAFSKVFLHPAEAKQAQLSFKRDAAAYFAVESNAWRVEAGTHQLRIATSSSPHDVRARIELEIPTTCEYSP